MHTALVFQCAVDIGSCDRTHDFFETACCSFRTAGHFELPTFGFAVFGIHAEEVAGEECSFVAAGSTTDFKDGVLGIFGIFGDEHKLDGFFELGNACFTMRHLFASHFFHLCIVLVHEDFFAFGEVAQ